MQHRKATLILILSSFAVILFPTCYFLTHLAPPAEPVNPPPVASHNYLSGEALEKERIAKIAIDEFVRRTVVDRETLSADVSRDNGVWVVFVSKTPAFYGGGVIILIDDKGAVLDFHRGL